MKKFMFFSVILIFALVGSASALENPWEKRLPFKSATVKYQVAGTMTGGKTLYIKDYGQTTAEYSDLTMKMFGMSQQHKEVLITTPEWVYTADLTENTGTKQANMNKLMLEEFKALSKSDQERVLENAEKLGVTTLDGTSAIVEKNAANIKGYDCDKVTLSGTVAFIIKDSDLPLKIEADTMGMKIRQEATDIDTGSVASSKFDLPDGIHFEHNTVADEMMKNQAHSSIQNLLQGKNPMGEGGAQAAGAAPSQGSQVQESPDSVQSQAGETVEKDAKDVGQGAKNVFMDQVNDQVQDEVKNMFKSIFD